MRLLPFIGYLLVAIAYMTRIPTVYKKITKEPTLLIGTIILVSSYLLLAKHKIEEKKETKKVNLPYAFLAVFFIFAYFIPLNITVRFYDIFAAFGYSLLFIASIKNEKLLLRSGLIVISIYYTLGGFVKIFEYNLQDILLLIGRLILAVYSILYFISIE